MPSTSNGRLPVWVPYQMENFLKWDPKKSVLVMGANTRNGNAISSNGKLRVWVLTHLHPTIAALYSTTTNPHPIILKRFHHIFPNIAASSCPPTIPQTELTQYFLTTLSPHSACRCLKKHSTGIVTTEQYNHVIKYKNKDAFTTWELFCDFCSKRRFRIHEYSENRKFVSPIKR